MTEICTVSGPLIDPTGDVLVNTAVTFVRVQPVGGTGTATVIGRDVTAVSDSAGDVEVDLLAGQYLARVIGTLGLFEFAVGVPDALTADLHDCIEQTPVITPGLVQQAVAAADRAEEAADRIDLGALDEAVAATAEDAAAAELDAAAADAARVLAQAARDAAMANAVVYADLSTGNAAVSNGAQFRIVSADGRSVQVYRRVDATPANAVLVTSYPTSAAVANVTRVFATRAAVTGLPALVPCLVVIMADETYGGLTTQNIWGGTQLTYSLTLPFAPRSLYQGRDGGFYDTQMLGTLWADTGRTVPATVGADVVVMDDISGNGRNVVFASGFRPILRQDSIGRYYLEVHAGDRGSSASGYVLRASGNYVLWAGEREAATAANLFGVGVSGVIFHQVTVRTSTLVAGSGRNPSGFVYTERALGLNTWSVVDSQLQPGSTDAAEGKKRLSTANGWTTETHSAAGIGIGVTSPTAGSAAAQKFYGGCVVQGVVTEAQRRAVVDYFAARAGRTLLNGYWTRSLSPIATQNIPDGLGADVGKGFTNTGLSKFPREAALWSGNDGRSTLADNTYQPSLVKLSLDGTTKLAEIGLGALFPGQRTVQGVACDGSDNTIWVARLQDNRVEHVTVAGANVGDGFTYPNPNGLAYDSVRNRLWICDSTRSTRINMLFKNGQIDKYIDVVLPDGTTLEKDHLYHDAARDILWITTQFGSQGELLGVSPETGDRILHFRFSNALEIEGAVVDGSTVYVNSDWYVHGTGPNNQLITYTLPA